MNFLNIRDFAFNLDINKYFVVYFLHYIFEASLHGGIKMTEFWLDFDQKIFTRWNMNEIHDTDKH